MLKETWIKEKKANNDYKRYIGPAGYYETIGQDIFSLFTKLGLKKTDVFLDIGCGCLAVGKYIIEFLNKNNYFGLDAESWLVENALTEELKEKNPRFDFNCNFDLEFVTKKLNYIFSNFLFIHLDLVQIDTCIAHVADKMNDNTRFIFNFFEGLNNKNVGLTYPGKVTYKKETIFRILEKHGLKYNLLDYKCKYKSIYIECYK